MCAGTAFLDGFNMVVSSVAMALFTPEIGFSATDMGLFASLYSIGVFIGAMFGGKIGDVLGRTVIFRLAPILITLASVGLFFTSEPMILIGARFFIGFCIGADYPGASTIVAEYTPGKFRSKSLVILMFAWYAGALFGSLVGFFFYETPGIWHFLLLTPAIPGVIFAIGRTRIPDTPLWFVSKGRTEDADKALKRVFGSIGSVDGLPQAAQAAGDAPNMTLMSAFKAGYLKRFVFVTAFWICQIIPVTCVFMFGPTIVASFGLDQGNLSVLGTAALYVFIMIGVLPAMLWINKMKRRTAVIGTYVVMTIALLALGFFADADPVFIIVIFAFYAFAYGLQSVFDNIYPPELFPTEVRSTAIGTITSVSKLAAAIGSFLFPIGLASMGLGPVVIIGGVISGIGLLISILYAPETQGMTLEESSSL